VIVRPERPYDHTVIAAVVGAAFGSPAQPRLVEDLRASPGYVPELALVADDPRCYSRFGFLRASELGIGRPHERTPEWAFQALPLPAYDEGVRGRVVYPPPFDGL
jgi:predicted N-acetyltransferase YhbS